MSESTTYKVTGTRVKGQGWSYNLTNQKDAERLCNTLNTYETTIQQLETQIQHNKNYETINRQCQQTEQTLDRIQKGIIQLQMSLKIAQEDLNKVKMEMDI